MNKLTFLMVSLFCAISVSGQYLFHSHNGYYHDLNDKSGAELKTALHNIIKVVNVHTYDQLWEDFQKTDLRDDSKIWDLYSGITSYVWHGAEQGARIKGEGSSYNREHSMPQSWFGKASPMVSDLHHIFPVDSRTNSMRNNWPYGENDGEKNGSAFDFSKLGVNKSNEAYRGTSFEPNARYKGDLARVYFYMVTCYENLLSQWPRVEGGKDVFTYDAYPALQEWQKQLLLKWAREDSVSTKEVKRNEEVYKIQRNRNPFVDFPGLEQYIWGDSIGRRFDLANYTPPQGYGVASVPTDQSVLQIARPAEKTSGVFEKVMSKEQLVEGRRVLFVYEEAHATMGEKSKKVYASNDSITINGNLITPDEALESINYLTLKKVNGHYAFQFSLNSAYMGAKDDKKTDVNDIYDVNNQAAHWDVTIAGGEATIQSVNTSNRALRYNTDTKKFALYVRPSTKFRNVSIYIEQPSTTGIYQLLGEGEQNETRYDLTGRRAKRNQRGVVIVNGKIRIQ